MVEGIRGPWGSGFGGVGFGDCCAGLQVFCSRIGVDVGLGFITQFLGILNLRSF